MPLVTMHALPFNPNTQLVLTASAPKCSFTDIYHTILYCSWYNNFFK